MCRAAGQATLMPRTFRCQATQKGITVELIIMLLAPFPIGYFIRNRMAAYLAYVALHSFVFTFQSTTLLKEWTGGDYSAFVKNPATAD